MLLERAHPPCMDTWQASEITMRQAVATGESARFIFLSQVSWCLVSCSPAHTCYSRLANCKEIRQHASVVLVLLRNYFNIYGISPLGKKKQKKRVRFLVSPQLPFYLSAMRLSVVPTRHSVAHNSCAPLTE